MNVLIVESPGKVKAINKYLGSDYKVLASFGHIRDLPSKDGSVKPDDDFSMIWDVDARAASKIKDIAAAVKGADKLILATDPDREGEAISWHILEVLKEKKLLDDLHFRTLERIFIEERIYKKIEQCKTNEAVVAAVYDGFKPFKKELIRDLTDPDVDRLRGQRIPRRVDVDADVVDPLRPHVEGLRRALHQRHDLGELERGQVDDALTVALRALGRITPTTLVPVVQHPPVVAGIGPLQVGVIGVDRQRVAGGVAELLAHLFEQAA